MAFWLWAASSSLGQSKLCVVTQTLIQKSKDLTRDLTSVIFYLRIFVRHLLWLLAALSRERLVNSLGTAGEDCME